MFKLRSSLAWFYEETFRWGQLRIDLARKTNLSYTDKDIQDLAMLYNNTSKKYLG